jgi:hypothetical protein
MAEQLWVIRAGQGARFVDDFLSGRIVGVDFSELASDDLAALGDRALKARATNPSERTFAGQLSAFAFGVDLGDLVIVPRLPKVRDYLVGRVAQQRLALEWPIQVFDSARVCPETRRVLRVTGDHNVHRISGFSPEQRLELPLHGRDPAPQERFGPLAIRFVVNNESGHLSASFGGTQAGCLTLAR